MPFKSEAQRRLFHAKAGRGEMSEKMVHEWEHATPKKVKKKLPYHVKKASIPVMAQLAVASDAFDKSLRGWEKKGMDSVSIAAFFDELEKLGMAKEANELTVAGRALGGLARTARTEMKAVSPALKTGVTQAMPALKPRAAGMHVAGGFSSTKAPVNIGGGAAHGATNAGVLPQSLGGGGLTKTHVRPQGSPTAQASNLRRNLAIGGAVGGAMVAGHMMPHHQQQQPQQPQRF